MAASSHPLPTVTGIRAGACKWCSSVLCNRGAVVTLSFDVLQVPLQFAVYTLSGDAKHCSGLEYACSRFSDCVLGAEFNAADFARYLRKYSHCRDQGRFAAWSPPNDLFWIRVQVSSHGECLKCKRFFSLGDVVFPDHHFGMAHAGKHDHFADSANAPTPVNAFCVSALCSNCVLPQIRAYLLPPHSVASSV